MTNKQGRRLQVTVPASLAMPRPAGREKTSTSLWDVDHTTTNRARIQCQSQVTGALWAEPCDGLLSNKICNAGSLRSIESKLMSESLNPILLVTSYLTRAIYLSLKVPTIVELLTAIAGTVLWLGILVFPGILSDYSA